MKTTKIVDFKSIEDELAAMNSPEEEGRCISLLLGILRGNNKSGIRAMKSTLNAFYDIRNYIHKGKDGGQWR